MKKLISGMIAMVCAVSTLGTTVKASAGEMQTPSNLAYSEIGNSIDSYVKEREAGLASCEVSVFDADGIIYNGYYGYSDIENNIPADSETVYEWGSCSKLLVWASVMQQWEQGKLDLNSDIRDYLPENFLTKLQYPDEKITMLNLMSHNAGFQESFYENQEASPDEVYDTLEEAVKACECYQAYHVGEYTAYSNWGTSLAAYIVEQTSGMDYVTYVNKNIFAPLGMEHTCIDPKMADNVWVAEKRYELKCYGRYEDPKYNEDLGECLYGIQLFPAGAATGTLEDFSTFAQAFVMEDCPLFENDSTREEMFIATSYYGDSDIVKNAHGLWTSEYKVQTLGHGGNTGGCSSNLVFDPESGVGIVIMANEPGESVFNYGIPNLIFGNVTEREGIQNTDISDTEDISGIYYAKRSITAGAAKIMSAMGSLMPWSKNPNGTYSLKLCGIQMGEEELHKIAEHQYVMQNNGMNMFMYYDNGKLEMMSTDYVKSESGSAGTFLAFGFILFGIGCLLTILVKLFMKKKYTFADKQILGQQGIYGVSSIILALFAIIIGGINPTWTAISGIMAMIIGLASLANGGILCYNTIKADDMKTRTKVKQFIWTGLGIAYFVFIIMFQLYRFWTL